MSYSVSQNKATQKYIKNKYDEIKIRVPKGKKDYYKKIAFDNGKSLNSFIIDLLGKSTNNNCTLLSPNTMVKQSLSNMAIENMYFEDDFISKIIKVANNKLSSEELRQEVLRQYAR